MDVIHRGLATEVLTRGDVEEVIAQAADRMEAAGQRVLVIVPDLTRSCPLGQVARLLHRNLSGRAKKVDFLIALGTHPALNDAQIHKLFDVPQGKWDEVFPGSDVFNHDWKDPAQLATIGTLSEEQIDEITGGLFQMAIDVTINRMVFDYDLVLVCGPVFPHEVVGFSGGAKYFFPGICGQELLDFFHWLGAVITCPKIIGTKQTPVRQTLHAALDMLEVRSAGLCMVVKGSHDDLAGLFYGPLKDAWSAAADLSAQIHVTRVPSPFQSILSRAPEMYYEIWVGAKCMYKMEPVVADGGELIIYAPHIHEISLVHGALIEEIGYHTRDYFLQQWDRFKHYPWGVLAHSTHVKGIGRYVDGVEEPRINVVLATAIPAETCRKVNLGYRDPASINIDDWQDRDDRLYVPKAGEMLYKLQNPPAWQTFEQND